MQQQPGSALVSLCGNRAPPTHRLSSPTQHRRFPSSTPTSTQTSSFQNPLYGSTAHQLGQVINPQVPPHGDGDRTRCSEQGSQWFWEPHHDFVSKSAFLFLIPSSPPLLFLVKWPPRGSWHVTYHWGVIGAHSGCDGQVRSGVTNAEVTRTQHGSSGGPNPASLRTFHLRAQREESTS